jgi:ribonuclease R
LERRRRRGSIDFDLPEPEVIFDLATGKMTGIIRSERNIAHRMIEEFMLLATEIVALRLVETGLPANFRVHERPPALKIGEFASVAATFGYRLPLNPERIRPKDLQELLERAAGKPEERFLNVLLLRAMARARYDVENLGHFGLALQHYAHFTSPIRRFPDLVVHRVLKTLLSGQKSRIARVRKQKPMLAEIAEHCSMTERRADDAEREFIQIKKIEFMRDKLGEVFSGHITGVTSFGLFVELQDSFVEGLVPLKYLDDDHYVYHERRHMYKGRRRGKIYRLGDPIEVQVVRVDRGRREIDFILA